MERLMRFYRNLLIFLLLSNFASLYGQSQPQARGVIAGHVKDTTTNEALPGVNVIVEGTTIGAASDIDGRFVIRGVPPGNYRVRATLIGYIASLSSTVKVTAGDTAVVNFQLRESAIDVPEVVVTASRKAQSFLETPVSVSVVNARQIERQNFGTLEALLEFAPGVSLMSGQINIRGSSGYSRGAGSRVLLLVDGVPMLPGDSGDIKWDQVPPNEVERVEVVKGAASSLYGSNALGGVVNVITKDPSETPITVFKSTAGIYDKPRYPEWRFTERTLFYNFQDISHSRSFDKLKMRASLGRRESTGYAQNRNYQRLNGFTKLKYNFTTTSFVTAYANYARNHGGESIAANSFNDITRVPESDAGLSTTTRRLQTGVAYQTILRSNITLRLRDSFYFNRFQNDLAETDPNPFVQANDPHIDSRAYKNDIEAQLDIELNPVHSSTFGVTGAVNHINSTLFGRHDGRDFSTYLQHEWKASTAVTLTGSLRFDYHWVDTGLKEYHLNPRFGMVYVVSPNASLRLSSGRGFRAATMAEMFTLTKASGFVVIPNPNLSSEIGWSHEVGGQFVLSNFFVNPAVFWSDYEDLIEGRFVTKRNQNVIQFQNFNRARIRGAEIDINTSFWKKRLTIGGSYTYLDARQLERRNDLTGNLEKVNEPLQYRPKHLLTGQATLTLGRYFFGVDSRYVSKVSFAVFPDQPHVAQKVTNFNAGVRIIPAEITLNVYNAFDYYYTQVESNLEPIRSVALTTAFAF